MSKIKRYLEESMSWGDLALLTHATQVKKFNWCMCEEQEYFPYDDCPREGERVMVREREIYTGECDRCGAAYDVSSRFNRCGDCGNCANCCSHNLE